MHVDMKLKEAKKALDQEQYSEALAILSPLANSGNADAQGYLGVMYQLGLGVERSGSEAVRWLQKAADQGNGSAAHNLGTIHLCGMPDVAPDRALAKKWYRKAHDLGFVVADNSWYE